MKQISLAAALALLVFTSCREIFARRIRGNGHITTQTRSAGRFEGVDVSGSINVYVKQDSTPSIRVEADDNLQQYIEANLDGDILRIQTMEGYNLRPSSQIKVYVSSALFRKLGASGACEIFSDGKISNASEIDVSLSGASGATLEADAPRIAVDLSGASTVKMKGQTRDFKIEGSGSSHIKCFDLVAENVTVDLSGAGDVEVSASAKLSGTISGAADVRYKGGAQANIETSGASSVKKVD